MVQQFKAGQIIGELILNDKKYQVALNKAGKSADKFEKGSKRRAKNVLSAWSKTFVGIGAGFATIRAFKSIIRASADLEERLANVSTLGNISAETMDMMKDRIKEMSGEVRQMPTDLVEALYDTISAGAKPGAEALKITEQAAKLATAGLTDARTAADALTTVLNAYGKSAEDAENVSDVLFSTVEKGKLRLDDLAQSIGKAIPSSAALGIQLEEVSAFLATATKRGFDTAEAVTALRAANTAFVKGADKFRAAGIDILKVISEKGLLGGLEALQKLTKGNIEAVQEYIPNQRALNGVLLAAGEGAADYADALESAKNAAGKTAVATEKQLKAQGSGVKDLQIALFNFKESLGDEFAEPVDKASGAITKLFNALTRLIEARKKAREESRKAREESEKARKASQKAGAGFSETFGGTWEVPGMGDPFTAEVDKRKAAAQAVRNAEIRRFIDLSRQLAAEKEKIIKIEKIEEIQNKELLIQTIARELALKRLVKEQSKQQTQLESAFQAESGRIRQSRFEFEQKIDAEIKGMEIIQRNKEAANEFDKKVEEAEDRAFEKRMAQQQKELDLLDKKIGKLDKTKEKVLTAGFNMKNFGDLTGRSLDRAIGGLSEVITSTRTMGEVFEQVGMDILGMLTRMIAKAAVFAALNAATGGALKTGEGFFGGIGNVLGFSRLGAPSLPPVSEEKISTPVVSPSDSRRDRETVFKFTSDDNLIRLLIDKMNVEVEDNGVRLAATETI